MKQFLILILCLVAISCRSQDCKELSTSFSSYSEAIREVKNADFCFTDKLPAGKSSWIKTANYYSCDNKTGYMIYTTAIGSQYIHANLPKTVWLQFKNAPSSGSYYDNNIKGRYELEL